MPSRAPHVAGERHSPGTGSFFGEKTHPAAKRSPENMDLSPLLRDFAVVLRHVEEHLQPRNLQSFFTGAKAGMSMIRS
jgi:hypothetical protein